jgi:hypothetical protein
MENEYHHSLSINKGGSGLQLIGNPFETIWQAKGPLPNEPKNHGLRRCFEKNPYILLKKSVL